MCPSKGEVEAERFVDGTWMTVQQPIANLAHEPGGNRASQLLFGERFLVLEVADGQAFGQSERDGYVGWVGSAALTQAPEATHWVISPATHLYPRADFKTQAEVALFFGSAVHVTAERQGLPPHPDRPFRAAPAPDAHRGALRRSGRGRRPVPRHALSLGWDQPLGPRLLGPRATGACGLRHGLPRDSDQQAEALGEDIDEGKRFSAATWCSGTGMSA
jgi:hypothetical protein